MDGTSWFWITVIVFIVALCINDTLSDYFKYKYGKKDNEDENT